MRVLGSKFQVTLILVLIMVAVLVTLPAVTAQARKQTYAYIGAIPNPACVGKEVLLHIGITDSSSWAQGGWKNLTVTVERPDGKTEKLGPYTTDLTGGTGVVYVPDKPGTYYLQTHFPEQVVTAPVSGIAVGTVMLASSSEKLALIVKEEPLEYYPAFPLPTEYWTRPIDAQIREWSSIAGSWVADPPNLFAPYNEGPETPHILWAKPLTMGGLIGGEFGEWSMEIGDAYEGKFLGRVIINGILYFNRHNTQDRGSASVNFQEVVAIDIHTGEELWSKPLKDPDGKVYSLQFGQMLYWDSFNLHGGYALLWAVNGTTWIAFDAFTGAWSHTLLNVPSGTNVYGPKGEICRVTVNSASGWMTLWNSTRAVNPQNTSSSWDGSWGRSLDPTRYGRIIDARRGIQWNKTIPRGLPGSVQATFLDDRVVGARITITEVNLWALSLKPEAEGVLLFNTTWTAPADWAAGNQTITWVASSREDKVGVLFSKETCQNYGFDLETGRFLWGPTTPPQHYLDALDDTKPGARAIAYGKLYCASVSGIVYCYDVKTGKLLWTYEATDPYTEILWANTWWMRPLFITDGKIYVGHYEHSPIDPRPRGAPFICLNATTGEVIFRADGLFRQTRWGGRAVIGDSIIATMDTYDQRVYAIGRGPSATTVEAPMVGVSLGSSIVIRGTVMDVSPGTNDAAIKLRFPNGVPAVADESMSDWMLYVYKQFPRPSDVKGVWVTFDALSPEGKWIHVGGTNTDSSGFYSIPWTPPSEGLWTIVITFPGSESYYASYAETSILVTAAPPQPQMPEIPTPPDYTSIFTVLIVLVIVAIAASIYSIYDHRKLKK